MSWSRPGFLVFFGDADGKIVDSGTQARQDHGRAASNQRCTVAIDIAKDTLISLEDAAKLFPKAGGGHIHPKTVRNWITLGYQGIKLEGAQVGSRFYTTTDALRLFSQRLNERRQSPPRTFARPAVADEDSSTEIEVMADDEFTVQMPLQPSTRNFS